MRVSRYWPVVDALGNMSYDPERKVGAIIIDADMDILSTGFNGFPRGINDDGLILLDVDKKLRLMVHAEQNAIYNAARVGVSVKGAALMCNLFPCVECAKAIIQSGITAIIAPNVYSIPEESKWRPLAIESQKLLEEVKVKILIRS